MNLEELAIQHVGFDDNAISAFKSGFYSALEQFEAVIKGIPSLSLKSTFEVLIKQFKEEIE
jgi:hypothetical protein